MSITTSIARRLRSGTALLSIETITDGQFLKRVGSTIVSAAAAVSGAITSSGLTMATNKLLGRGTAGTGAVETITLGTGLSLAGTTLNASTGITNAAGANVIPKSDGTNLVASQVSDDGTAVALAAAGTVGFTGRSKIASASDGAITLTNNAGSSFTQLNLGGTSSSFPAIQRNSTQLRFVKADNSSLTETVSQSLVINDQARLYTSADGVVRIVNFADSSFGRLQFGGTTSSFPSLKRSTTGLQVRLADDSASTWTQSKRLVTAKTGDYTVLDADVETFFTNTAAGAGVIFTLPTPVVGMTYEFYRDANQTVTVDVGGAVTIQVGASVSTAGGNITLDAVGSRIRLVAISTTQWVGDVTGAATFN